MSKIPINFLESLVQNLIPDISSSTIEKLFPALLLASLANILFLLLGRVVNNLRNLNLEKMMGIYFGFIAVVINGIIFCYLTNSNWSFWISFFVLWFIGSLCYGALFEVWRRVKGNIYL